MKVSTIKIINSIDAIPKIYKTSVYPLLYNNYQLIIKNYSKLVGLQYTVTNLNGVESFYIKIENIYENEYKHKNNFYRLYTIELHANFSLFSPLIKIEISRYPFGKFLESDTDVQCYNMHVISTYSIKNNNTNFKITKNVLQSPNDFLEFLYKHIELNHMELI